MLLGLGDQGTDTLKALLDCAVDVLLAEGVRGSQKDSDLLDASLDRSVQTLGVGGQARVVDIVLLLDRCNHFGGISHLHASSIDILYG